MTDRHAEAIARAISDTTAVSPEIARLQGIQLAGVFQIIISESGRRSLEGQSQEQIASELYLVAESLLEELDRWFSIPPPRAPRCACGSRAAEEELPAPE